MKGKRLLSLVLSLAMLLMCMPLSVYAAGGEAVIDTVKYNGNLVYTSPTESGSYAGYFRSSYDGATTNADGNLAAGEYTITFFSPENVELASGSCTVTD